MKTKSWLGLLAGGVVLLGGGIGFAATRKPAAQGGENFFLYAVQPGDTLSALALKFFGDAKKWSAFRDGEGKELDDGKALLADSKLRVPCSWTVVAKGESLPAVAARTLGDKNRWRRILEANKKAIPDPDKIAVGLRLAVPQAPDMPAQPSTPGAAPEPPAALPPGSSPPVRGGTEVVAIGALDYWGVEDPWGC